MKFSVPGLTSLHLTNRKDTGEVLHFRPSALFWVSQVKAGPVEGHGMTAKSADQNDHRFAVGFGHEIIVCLGMRPNAEDCDGNKRHERYMNK